MVEADYYDEEYRDFKIKFYYDEDYDSPRNWEPATHIICWDSRNCLGDEHNYEEPRDLFIDLFYELMPCEEWDNKITAFMQGPHDDVDAKYIEYTDEERKENNTSAKGYYRVYNYPGDLYEDFECDSLEEGISKFCNTNDIADYFSNGDLLEFIEDYLVIMPISEYEHSGITVWYGSPNDPWDSGYIGYGYMTKEEVLRIYPDATEDNWREKAEGLMEAEMKEYDTYVRGEVYGYMVEVGDEAEDEEYFSDTPDIVGESCWGFYGDEGIKDAIDEAKSIIDSYYDSLEDKRIEDIIKGCLDTENA